MKFLVYSMALLFVCYQPAFGDQDTQEVRALVVERIDQVIELIKDKTMDKGIRNDKIIGLVKPILDFDLMAKLSLGKKNWKKLTKPQRQEFSELFIEQLQDSFLEKLDLYTDEKVSYGEAKKLKKKIEVVTFLISKDSKIEIVYKFYKSKKKGWQAYDVMVIGVSFIQTYRTQFDAVIKKGGVESLLRNMKQKGQFKIPDKQETT